MSKVSYELTFADSGITYIHPSWHPSSLLAVSLVLECETLLYKDKKAPLSNVDGPVMPPPTATGIFEIQFRSASDLVVTI